MKGRVNNPNGKPPLPIDKKRKTLCVRVKPTTIKLLKDAAMNRGVSQSSIIDKLIEREYGA